MENLRRLYSDEFLSTLSADEMEVVKGCYTNCSDYEVAGHYHTAQMSIMHLLFDQVIDDELWVEIAADNDWDFEAANAQRRSEALLWRKLYNELRKNFDELESELFAWEAA